MLLHGILLLSLHFVAVSHNRVEFVFTQLLSIFIFTLIGNYYTPPMFYKMTPFEKVGSTIKVAMVDPNNIDAMDALKFISIKRNVKTKVHLVSRSGFGFADGHAESWKWNIETLKLFQDLDTWQQPTPKTDEGIYDLKRILDGWPAPKR